MKTFHGNEYEFYTDTVTPIGQKSALQIVNNENILYADYSGWMYMYVALMKTHLIPNSTQIPK
jgi:hypothetical protein